MTAGASETLLRYMFLFCGGVILLNMLLSLALWMRERAPLQRSLVLLWAAILCGGVAHGTFSTVSVGPLLKTIPFWSAFPISLAMADLLARVARYRPSWRLYATVFLATALSTVVMGVVGLDFWMVAIPSAIGVSFPVFHAALIALSQPRGSTSLIYKATAVSCLLSGLHNLDYPFLGNRPEFALLGFTVVLLVVFAISTTAPAVILERVALERTRIEQLDRLKSQFFSNITHELRTPLTMILAPLESLLDGQIGDLRPQQKEYLRPIQRSAFKLLKLINDLLDLAKIDEQYLRLRIEQTDLVSLVNNIVEEAKPLASRKDIAINLDLCRTAGDLLVDPECLERAIVNILSNAFKFTPSGGQVTVWMRETDTGVELGVRDSGIGIPTDQLKRVFERFSQADESVSRQFGGTGLGLALAKEIVELHGGSVTVSSREGEGSEFVIHLPRGDAHLRPEIVDRRQSQHPSVAPRRGEDHEPREWTRMLLERKDYRYLEIAEATERRIAVRGDGTPKSHKILVVEDNADVLRFVNMQLKDTYDVYLAPNGVKGLELALREIPDVVITDYMMPEMDGLTLLRKLRGETRTQNIPVIMLTAKSQIQDRIDAREAGAEIFLNKPFSPRELRTAIDQLLEKTGRQLSHTLHEQVKSLEHISAGLAHEIHNPLNYIRSALFVIEEVSSNIRAAANDPAKSASVVGLIGESQEKIQRMHQIAQKGVERIARIVELVRNYAREGYVREPTAIDIDTVLKGMALLLSPANDYVIQVDLELQAQGAQVLCIAEDLQQALGNIWQNALDASRPGGRVVIRTRIDSESVVVEVQDDGPGIPRGQLGQIFAPFFTTKGPGKGLGLGLSISYQVIHEAGGTIAVDSIEHQGTTFSVRLPKYVA